MARSKHTLRKERKKPKNKIMKMQKIKSIFVRF